MAEVLRLLSATRVTPKRDIGRTIKRLREAKGLSQAELARRSGVSQGYISRLEPSGERQSARHKRPSQLVLVKLAAALGVPLSKLIE